MSDNHFEQPAFADRPDYPRNLALLPSASDLQVAGNNAFIERQEANREFINGGIFPDLTFDFSSDPLLAQALHYRDYPTSQPLEPAHCSILSDPFNAQHKLITGESNQPDVSQGIANLNDADRLLRGVTTQGLKMIDGAIEHLSHPYAVNQDIESLGPMLDRAVDYYAKNDLKTVQHDAGVFTAAGLDQINQTIDSLSYPMNQEKIGEQSAAAMPAIIFGKQIARDIGDAGAGFNQLRQLENAELRPLGVFHEVTDVHVDAGKVEQYCFGRLSPESDAHNWARGLQLRRYMEALQVPENEHGYEMLRNHFEEVGNRMDNISNVTITRTGRLVETRDSLFIGPSGKVIMFETKWGLEPGGIRHLDTMIPHGEI